ncbi:MULTISPECIES: recombinase family protein [Streptacidiphilus]|uniref:Recombinase family protein n=1 Tax=Streptacidiphilus cavernicola TaxID=3342716 RepID=A0ABV6V0H7_9ACTN|nr:recombinase family protein [Streptacidiphilus jeojiense]
MPAGLASPDELEKQRPEATLLIAYSRISDDWRAHSKKKAARSAWTAGKGVANQHRRNDTNAARFNTVIVYRYTDNDLSASKRDVVRPDFQAMLRDLRRGVTPEGHRIDGVICVDQDRIQRTDRDWEDFVEALTAINGRLFWTPSGSSDLTEEGEIIKSGVMGLVNKVESMKKKRRIRDWHQDRILDGLPHSGPRPFGWEEDRETLRPAESDFLSWAIDERIKGKAVSTLCLEAKRQNLVGTRGGKIVGQTLTQMMTAPRVCGFRANRGVLVLDEFGEPLVGKWQTVTTPEKWRAVCATFSDGSTWLARGSGTPRITGVKKEVKYLGSVLLRCVNLVEEEDESGNIRTRVCNHSITGAATKSKLSPYNYTCQGCRRNAMSGPVIDRQLQKLLFAKLARAQVTYEPRAFTWPREGQLRTKIEKLRTLEQQWQDDVIGDGIFYRNAPGLEQDIKELQQERLSWEKENAQGTEAPGDILKKWKSGEYDLSQKRSILFKMFIAVQLSPGVKGNRTPDVKRLKPIWND